MNKEHELCLNHLLLQMHSSRKKLKEAEDILFEIDKDSNPVFVYKKVQKYKEKYYGKKI